MLKISGTYTEAAVYSDTAEDYAIAQIKMICDNAVSAGSRIAVMPDVHPGKVGPIGLTKLACIQLLKNRGYGK